MANELLNKHYEPAVSAGLRVDLVFAYPDLDDASGEPINDAITKNGIRALGLCRVVNAKDRAKGNGDVEILIDGYWWERNDYDERLALLDHELYHIVLRSERDDMGRPKIKLRKHDVEFGWFNEIARRHGINSQERIQAKSIMDNQGQYYFPQFAVEPVKAIGKGGK